MQEQEEEIAMIDKGDVHTVNEVQIHHMVEEENVEHVVVEMIKVEEIVK